MNTDKNMKKEIKRTLIYLKFDDPASLDGWTNTKEAVRKLSNGDNEAVGWVFYETKKHYFISAHKSDDCENSISACLKIPKSIVIEKKILKL